jgi:penicillin-binding protein 1A
MLITIAGISAVLIFVSIFIFEIYQGAFGNLPGITELSSIKNEQASIVYSSEGMVIGEFFTENRINITMADIPVHLKNALIATEDKRFFSRTKSDIRSIVRVLFKTILLGNKNGGGGSTLSQQLIKNIYGRADYGVLSLPVNKIKEIILAGRIEKIYSKDQLILLYLNSVPFGEEVYGVESAARRYFSKHTNELSVQESAVLIGLLKANTFFNPRLNPANSLARRNLVLTLMAKEHYLSKGECDSVKELPLELKYENMQLTPPAGYFVFQVKKRATELLDSIASVTGQKYNLEKDGLRIYTTLSLPLQRIALEAVKDHLSVMQKLLDNELVQNSSKKQWYTKHGSDSKENQANRRLKEVELFDWNGMQVKKISSLDSLWYYYKLLNAAVLIADPRNGKILAWIGGNHFGKLPFDMVLSHRQVASAFKPFVYATAIEQGFTPCDYLANAVSVYPQFDDWEPQNYDHTSTPDSAVAFWYALVNSINLPTVDLYFKVGSEDLLHTCRMLGFPEISEKTPSIALGTLDLSLFEVVRAYSTFANYGKMNELVMIDKIVDSQGNTLYENRDNLALPIFSHETSDKITAILQQVINQGTASRIRNEYGIKAKLAGKTGSAQNYSDAWFIAYTPEMVIGTWVGAFSPGMHFENSKGSGSSLALPIVAKVIKRIERDDTLRKNYLTPFDIPDETYSFLQCEPYRQKGIPGFLNRLLNEGLGKKSSKPPNDKEGKKVKKRKSFFDKIFKDN